MADFLRDMDPAHRAALVIFLAVTIKSFLFVQWERFKEREAIEPTPMKLKNGVYVANGIVQRLERFIKVALWIWLAYIVVCVCLLIYMKAMGWQRLF